MGRPTTVSADDIVAAAGQVFAERGYGATSLRQLMTAAGVSTSAFYSRFQSKQDVLIALVDSVMSALLEGGSNALVGAAGLEDGIERGLDVLVGVLSANKPVVRVALTEGAAVPEVRASLASAYGSLAALLGAHIAGLAGARMSRRFRSHGWALVGALQMQIIRWAVFEELADDELRAELRRTADALLHRR